MQNLFTTPTLKDDLIDVATWYDRRTEQTIPYQRVCQQLGKAERL